MAVNSKLYYVNIQNDECSAQSSWFISNPCSLSTRLSRRVKISEPDLNNSCRDHNIDLRYKFETNIYLFTINNSHDRSDLRYKCETNISVLHIIVMYESYTTSLIFTNCIVVNLLTDIMKYADVLAGL